MTLKTVTLENFRSFERKTISFDQSLTILLGNNAVGKTNILESIFFILTGKGIKDEKQEELLRFGENIGSVKAELNSVTFRIVFKQEQNLKKAYFVDRAKKLLQHYISYTPPVVLFAPGRMSIIDGPSSNRRKYFDSILSKIDVEYRRNIKNYESALRKRNKILEKAETHINLQDDLAFWDDYLTKHAVMIQEKREWFTNYINEQPHVSDCHFKVSYKKNAITEERLAEYFMKQFYQKRTLVGPQRDEFIVDMNKSDTMINVHTFGSRGEQRLALLWLLLRESSVYVDQLKVKPIILLDDIFSELDDPHKKAISHLVNTYQTIISSTEAELATWPEFTASIVKIGLFEG